MAKDSIIIAEDYDGVYVDDVEVAFKNLLRTEGQKNPLLQTMHFDGFKELGYQLFKSKALLHFVLGHLPTGLAPRPEALEIFNAANGSDVEFVLLTSNPKLDPVTFERESERSGIRVHAVYVRNPMDKGMILDAMSEGKKLLFEDDPTVAQKAASYKNVEVGIVRESYNSIGSRLVSANPRIHRLGNWSEAISLAQNFVQSNLNAQQSQKAKSFA